MLEEEGIISQEVPCFDDWLWVMAYPGIKVSTAEARAILPAQYRRQDCISTAAIWRLYSRLPHPAAAAGRQINEPPAFSRILQIELAVKPDSDQRGMTRLRHDRHQPAVEAGTADEERAAVAAQGAGAVGHRSPSGRTGWYRNKPHQARFAAPCVHLSQPSTQSLRQTPVRR
ncbi:hypothetical protein ABMB44_13125 [Levilactobacillus brevis]